MSRVNLPGTFWPSPFQTALLEVALGEPARATAAWRSVRAQFELDELEQGSYELLPLIYRNLGRAGVVDPVMPRLKGIYRKAWASNSLLIQRTQETGEALGGADVPALFVEGVVLAERFYPDLALRPASVVDVLVEGDDVSRALVALAQVGWHQRPDSTASDAVQYLGHDGGQTLALRSRLATDFHPSTETHASRGPLWENAERRTVGNAELLVPTSTDTLLAICVTNARAIGGRATRWLVDAKMVLAHDVDWDRLIAVAIEHRQSVRVRDTLVYLASLPGARAPESVPAALTATRATYRERLAYRAAAGGGWRTPLSAGRRALRRLGAPGTTL